MLRLVIDSNVMASAFRSRLGASFALIELVRMERVRMLATVPMFLEYEDVLKRRNSWRPRICRWLMWIPLWMPWPL
jgi:predicted nucleic acid-binding protein